METSVTSSLLSRRPSYFSYDSTDKEYKAQVNITYTFTSIPCTLILQIVCVCIYGIPL